jgi:hypothetical protein
MTNLTEKFSGYLEPVNAKDDSEAEIEVRELRDLLLYISQIETALDDIASRTDWDRDDCGKCAADAMATLETAAQRDSNS